MRMHYVHLASILREPGADGRAPGGAVTLALCGSWEHDGPCRWPHHTTAQWEGDEGDVRVVFVVPAVEEEIIRSLIAQALRGGHCTGPDGLVSRWKLRTHAPGVLTAEEAAMAAEIDRA